MGKRGPRPTPTDELAKRGSWRAKTADRVNEVVIAALDGAPEPPSWLSPRAVGIWVDHAAAACDSGLLTPLDVGAFAMYCDLLAKYLDARDDVNKRGYTIETEQRIMANPSVKAMNEAAGLVHRFLREIGHTPASRVGLVLGKDAKRTPKPELKLFAKG